MYFQMPTQSGVGWRPQSLGSYPVARRRRPARRVALLGDADSIFGSQNLATIMNQTFAGQTGAPAAANVRLAVSQAMAQDALWTSEDCSGIVTGGSTASLVLSAGGSAAISFGTKLLAAGAATGPLAPIVLIAGGIMEVFGAIYAHHAQKVKQEQQIICAVVQAMNDSFSVIDQGVQQQLITPAQAGPSLDQLYVDLQQNVQPILKQDNDHCNAACFILAMARAVIAQKKMYYASLPPPPPPAPSIATDPVGAASSFVTSLSTSTGLPAVAIWGIGAVAAAKILGLF